MPSRIRPKKNIRTFLAAWRLKKGLTQEQVGDRIEPPVGKGTVSRWEKAKKVNDLRLGVLAAYAEAIGVEVTQLYHLPPKGDEDPSLDDLAEGVDKDLRHHVAQLLAASKGMRRAG